MVKRGRQTDKEKYTHTHTLHTHTTHTHTTHNTHTHTHTPTHTHTQRKREREMILNYLLFFNLFTSRLLLQILGKPILFTLLGERKMCFNYVVVLLTGFNVAKNSFNF